jgi:hypothetical protein
MASTAIPLVFPPVEIKGDYLVDGGLLHVNPLGELINRHDPDEIIIVNTYVSELRDLNLGRPKNAIDYAGKLLRIVMAHAMNDDIHRFLHINRMVEESGVPLYSPSGKRYKYFKYRLIEALAGSQGDSIDFTNADRRLIQHGYDQLRGMRLRVSNRIGVKRMVRSEYHGFYVEDAVRYGLKECDTIKKHHPLDRV